MQEDTEEGGSVGDRETLAMVIGSSFGNVTRDCIGTLKPKLGPQTNSVQAGRGSLVDSGCWRVVKRASWQIVKVV